MKKLLMITLVAVLVVGVMIGLTGCFWSRSNNTTYLRAHDGQWLPSIGNLSNIGIIEIKNGQAFHTEDVYVFNFQVTRDGLWMIVEIVGTLHDMMYGVFFTYADGKFRGQKMVNLTEISNGNLIIGHRTFNYQIVSRRREGDPCFAWDSLTRVT